MLQVTLPGLGFETYFVRPGNSTSDNTATSYSPIQNIEDTQEDIVLQNEVCVLKNVGINYYSTLRVYTQSVNINFGCIISLFLILPKDYKYFDDSTHLKFSTSFIVFIIFIMNIFFYDHYCIHTLLKQFQCSNFVVASRSHCGWCHWKAEEHQQQ